MKDIKGYGKLIFYSKGWYKHRRDIDDVRKLIFDPFDITLLSKVLD